MKKGWLSPFLPWPCACMEVAILAGDVEGDGCCSSSLIEGRREADNNDLLAVMGKDDDRCQAIEVDLQVGGDGS